MAKRKITKASKRRLSIFGGLCLIFIAVFFGTLIHSAISMYQLQKEEKNLKSELKTLRGDADELNTEIDKLNDKDYVARYARENYLYTKDGEYVLKIEDSDIADKKNTIMDITTDKIAVTIMLIFLLILIYMINKHRKLRKKKK